MSTELLNGRPMQAGESVVELTDFAYPYLERMGEQAWQAFCRGQQRAPHMHGEPDGRTKMALFELFHVFGPDMRPGTPRGSFPISQSIKIVNEGKAVMANPSSKMAAALWPEGIRAIDAYHSFGGPTMIEVLRPRFDQYGYSNLQFYEIGARLGGLLTEKAVFLEPRSLPINPTLILCAR